MKDYYRRRTVKNLIPLLFFLSTCLLFVVINPFSWILGDPLFVEYCFFEVDNQSGKTLHLTPIYIEANSYSPISIYRTTFPNSPAYQQRNITVNPDERISLAFDCSEKISKLYICDPEGNCYLSQSFYQRIMIKSLESLDRPDATLQAALASFPEHDYHLRVDVLLCFVLIIALLGGFYCLRWTKSVEMPHNI